MVYMLASYGAILKASTPTSLFAWSIGRRAEDARLVALPMQRGIPLAELHDEVAPDGVLESVKVSLLGLPVEQHAYNCARPVQAGIATRIWAKRAPSITGASTSRVSSSRTKLKRRYGIERDVRFDIVAHWMGGLIASYYLRYGSADLPVDGSAPSPPGRVRATWRAS